MGHDAAKVDGRGSNPLGGTWRAECAALPNGCVPRRATVLSAAILRRLLGRAWIPTPGLQCSIHWRRAGHRIRCGGFSGCSSVVERGVRDLEAAGAIPVTQTIAGARFTARRWGRAGWLPPLTQQ